MILPAQRTEGKIACSVLHRMTRLGKPRSPAISVWPVSVMVFFGENRVTTNTIGLRPKARTSCNSPCPRCLCALPEFPGHFLVTMPCGGRSGR